MAVRIKNAARVAAPVERWLQAQARRHIRSLSQSRVPGAAALKKAELSLLLTTNRGIRKLNREWRGLDKPTDVLSFPLLSEEELRRLGRRAARGGLPEWELGDLVISVERAREQAAIHGVTFRQELDLLLVHGLLHLLGFDHELSPAEEKRMRRWEERLTGRRGLL